MASFKFDQVHLPPNPAPKAGKIVGRLIPGVADAHREYEIVFRDNGGSEVCRTTATITSLSPIPVECSHNVTTGNQIVQRNLTVQVIPGSTTMPLPVFLC